MRRAVPLLVAALAAPLRADTDRFFAMASDYLQALHSCKWAAQVDVGPRRPVVALALALTEQASKLNEARLLLSKHAQEPVLPARVAVDGLMNGAQLLSLAAAADMADINEMSDKWSVIQKLEGRRAERREAVDVMAAAVGAFQDALFETVEVKAGRRTRKVRRPRLEKEDMASLVRQIDLFFGEDFPAAADAEPLANAAQELRRALVEAAAAGAKKSP